MGRIRKALGLKQQATLAQIAFHVECAVADVERLHAEKMALKYPDAAPSPPASAREPAWTARMLAKAQAALSHQIHRTHEHSPLSCDGCADAEFFIAASLHDWSGRAALETERGEK